MTDYLVTIAAGDLTWTIDSTAAAEHSDSTRVLDQLSIGWTMPRGSLWPQQPDPMSASFAINVPDFSGPASELAEGDPCAVTVEITDGPTYAIHGRITDLQAVPRPGKRPGVTLSVALVDYGPDLAQKGGWAFTPGVGATVTIGYVLDRLWDDHALGIRPPIAEYDPALVSYPVGEAKAVTEWIETLLRSWLINPLDPEQGRLVVAPNIDPGTGQPDADQPWAFDLVYRNGNATGDAYYIVGSQFFQTDTLVWKYDKNAGPSTVEVSYGTGGETIASAAIVIPAPRIERVETWLDDTEGALASQLAAFYCPDDLSSAWRIETVRLLVDRLDPGQLIQLQNELFPQHHVPAPSTARSACYGRAVLISDVAAHRTPIEPASSSYPYVDVGGRLVGATLAISSGRIALDLQLRQNS